MAVARVFETGSFFFLSFFLLLVSVFFIYVPLSFCAARHNIVVGQCGQIQKGFSRQNSCGDFEKQVVSLDFVVDILATHTAGILSLFSKLFHRAPYTGSVA